MDFDTFQAVSGIFAKRSAPSTKEDELYSAAQHIEVANTIEALTSELPLDSELAKLVVAATRNMRALANNHSKTVEIAIGPVSEAGKLRFERWLNTISNRPKPIAAILGGYLFETRIAQGKENTIPIELNDLLVEAELASYAAWKAYADGPARAQDEEFERTKKHFDETASALLNTAREQFQQASSTVTAMQKTYTDTQSLISRLENSAQQTISHSSAFLDSAKDQISNLHERVQEATAQIASMREDLGTISTKKLWDKRANSSSWSFRLSSALLLLLLVGGPVWGIFEHDKILGFIVRVEQTLIVTPAVTAPGPGQTPSGPPATLLAIIAVGRLFLITLPIVLYLWLIRLVVRFNQRSLMLLDDANQRHTMMDTYFHLIAEQAAVKEDRALILNALFRPTPGQSGDSVDPPNFTELVDKAMGK
ncbi:hypothetical protein [Pararhizobium arenae]|uniref:hypothetical protein n=1 Tax=Pararhizobium arenae TaxID=1856850 RepID=UPI00094B24F6|nr:hypothetical protein [Pararhizobium arenae]